jgi:hypothetical protein
MKKWARFLFGFNGLASAFGLLSQKKLKINKNHMNEQRWKEEKERKLTRKLGTSTGT